MVLIFLRELCEEIVQMFLCQKYNTFVVTVQGFALLFKIPFFVHFNFYLSLFIEHTWSYLLELVWMYRIDLLIPLTIVQLRKEYLRKLLISLWQTNQFCIQINFVIVYSSECSDPLLLREIIILVQRIVVKYIIVFKPLHRKHGTRLTRFNNRKRRLKIFDLLCRWDEWFL